MGIIYQIQASTSSSVSPSPMITLEKTCPCRRAFYRSIECFPDPVIIQPWAYVRKRFRCRCLEIELHFHNAEFPEAIRVFSMG